MLLKKVQARDAESPNSLQHHQESHCGHDVHVLAVADLIDSGGRQVAFWDTSNALNS